MPPDIVLISPYPAPGRTHSRSSGVVSYTANLARALAGSGASVVVVGPDEMNTPRTYSDGDVTVVRCGPRGPHALTRAVRLATHMSPRVIHLQHELFLFGGATSLLALPLAMQQLRRFEGAAVTTVHQVVGGEDMNSRMMRLHRLHGSVNAARMVMSGYHGLVASASVPIVHETGFARHFHNAVVIPHGVERKATPDRVWSRQRLGLGQERRLVVLCFGFVAPYKGLESVLAAAADVPEVLLVVAGGNHPRHGASYTSHLRQSWGDTARFTGWVPEGDIGAWHSAADLALFCYPYPHSSSGAVATALGHGTPLMASEQLANCMDLPNQLAVPINPDRLAERLRHLAANRDSLADLRHASASIATGRFWPLVARRHLQLYDHVAADAVEDFTLGGGAMRPDDEAQLEVA